MLDKRTWTNIVVAAKTAVQHPELQSTIRTIVEEMEKGLACSTDVRHESEIENALETAVKKFDGFDILINNASAISLTGTVKTPMKKFDLMHNVNAIILSASKSRQKCLLFAAYTLAKYGMSLCVLGMSEKLKRYGIAVNALWTETGIWTAAIEVLGALKMVFSFAIRSHIFTVKFVVDEEVLMEEGMKSFDNYTYEAGSSLILDFFVPGMKAEDVYPSGGEVDLKK
ncbi:unnamed protein product [Enterobius vermicularis]|uniref:Hydroxysteroid 17-beta dehydrogenase 11 n=1 Tax=Enterobius vermicularis TaxID=51028 RepID=A0A0N4V995_ENTVE|nr:unnamed protein product [Enterobius vermicularis]